jgi:cellulose synthase/poly-beta-1,6-N-acetylglucosamine synthase-like glycosyltransferase
MSVGEKRNALLKMAKGDYVCFIDDDDMVSEDYVPEILHTLTPLNTAGQGGLPDVVTFNAVFIPHTADGIEKERVPVVFGLEHLLNVDEPGKPRIRVPNHLCPIKRSIAMQIMFEPKNFGEDTAYGLKVRKLLKSEVKIEKTLYYYRFSETESETHKFSPKYRNREKGVRNKAVQPHIEMDVIMVSDCTIAPLPPEGGINSAIKRMTKDAVDSVNGPNVNIIVLEKHPKVVYNGTDTIHQSACIPPSGGRGAFNYNACLNAGAQYGNAEYICFTNNDVCFPKDFVTKVITEMQSPIRGAGGLDVGSVLNQHGFIHPSCISGFCFIMRRDAWLKIGKLNEDYFFWCADNVVTEQIKQHHLKSGNLGIKVFHQTSVSLNGLPENLRPEYTTACVKKFNREYGRNILNMGV